MHLFKQQDHELAERIKRAVDRDGQISLETRQQVSIKTQKGVITVYGRAKSVDEAAHVIDKVKMNAEFRQVVDALTILKL